MSITRYWTGSATNTPDVWVFTINGGWAPGNEIDLSVGSKEFVLKVGTVGGPANIATAIATAWNRETRLDGSDNFGCTTNIGGAAFGELYELAAEARENKVIFSARTAGKPIELASSRTSDTTGNVTLTSDPEVDPLAQTATGRHFWDNPFNWYPFGVPEDGDTLILRNSDISILYSLPQGPEGTTDGLYQRHDLTIENSFTGRLGLAPTNVDDGSRPYPEYRPRAPLFGSGHAVFETNSTWTIGLGEGDGSRLINLGYVESGFGNVTVNVYKTAQPYQGAYAVHAALLGEAKINVHGDSTVAITPDFGLDSQIARLYVSGPGAKVLYTGNHATDGFAGTIANGAVLAAGKSFTEDVWNILGGTVTFDDFVGFVDLYADGPGIIVWNSTGSSIEVLRLTNGSTFDAEQDARPFTIGDVDMFAGATLADKFGRGTYTNGIDLNRCGPHEVELRLGANRRINLDEVGE